MQTGIPHELAAVNRFVELLRVEQAALMQADVERLIALSEQKFQQSGELNTLAQTRSRLWAEQGHAATAEGIRQWRAALPSEEAVLWDALLDSARTARQLNQTNGKLIHAHLQHHQQALNALLSAADRAGVYGADGQARGVMPTTQRSISSA